MPGISRGDRDTAGLCELRNRAVSPVWTDSSHIERSEYAFRLAEIAPVNAGHADDRELPGKMRQHLLREIYFLQVLIHILHGTGFCSSAEDG